ncbi:hypothetical protein CLIB1423_26S00870 [[Candida] railenensis]|uniref:Uncharacterized protein n=1 Tax=[Candida] railenensis TaxID=45579 RepID=A0A9P0W1A8_9ASCO|nr:hypothetical protein CLIB1423_26S00870 [[Candida] railenensis]
MGNSVSDAVIKGILKIWYFNIILYNPCYYRCISFYINCKSYCANAINFEICNFCSNFRNSHILPREFIESFSCMVYSHQMSNPKLNCEYIILSILQQMEREILQLTNLQYYFFIRSSFLLQRLQYII